MARIEYKTATGKLGAINIDLKPFERKGKEAFLRSVLSFYVKALSPMAESKVEELLNTLWDVNYPAKVKAIKEEVQSEGVE